jgi:acyl carrier protein
MTSSTENPMPAPTPAPPDDAALRAALLDVIATIAPETRGRTIHDDDDLREAFDLDSMDMLNVVRALKARLGVDVPARDTPRLYTLTSAVAVLRGLLR